MPDITYQVTLDDKAQTKFEKIKQDYRLETDKGVFTLSMSLACELTEHLDQDGCINLNNGIRIKVR